MKAVLGVFGALASTDPTYAGEDSHPHSFNFPF